jgi:hypothetical protein
MLLSRALSVGTLLVLTCGTLRGASLLWGSATNISGNSDVLATGTLIEAVNQGSFPFGPVPSATVNGVTFVGWGVTGAGPHLSPGGRFALAGAPGHFPTGSNVFGSASAPFSGLSADYKVLLAYLVFSQNSINPNDFTGGITLTINNLTIGAPYKFQWWTNDSRPFATGPIIATTAPSSVALNPNTTNSAGGLGQFATGTFVADSTSQVIVFTTGGNANGQNAFQLRGGNGNFNGDNIIDAADFTVWRDTLGSTTNFAADGNEDQVIDINDYLIWKSTFGLPANNGASHGAAVPEPECLAILWIAGVASWLVPRVS